MKFCKKYQEYMQGQEKKLPGVGFKKLKKILKNCRRDFQSKKEVHGVLRIQSCPQHCPVCDGTFFPSLLKEMSDVVGCFNERAQKLLELHLASGFRKYFIWFKGKLQGSHVALIQEGKDLVNYALINAIAIRKILKKYDKVHYSKQGQAFRSQAQSKHMEILQSPWLCELMAFHINIRETKVKLGKTLALFEGCYLTFNDGKPFLSCELFDSVKLDIDLTCSICLDTVFDPVSLTCGHIFCYLCACSSASVGKCHFPEKIFPFAGKSLISPFFNLSMQGLRAMAVARSYPLQFLMFFLIASILYQSCDSFLTPPSSIINPSKVKQVSWKPRAFVYEGFLTELECDHLISLAKSELKRSAVADNVSGQSKLSDVRTSSGMFIPKGKDPIVAGIEDKISTWTFLPKENGEDIQVLRYEHGQKYDLHYDYFADKVNIARGGHRIATILMYLTNVTKGGETVFPEAEEPSHRRTPAKDNDLSECAKKGIAVKPRRGDALLFFSLFPTAIPDTSSLHGGCPVIEGEKWSATKWIHVDSFDKNLAVGGNCTDLNESCERWAALGECSKNREYMIGSAELPGYCRRSCKVC